MRLKISYVSRATTSSAPPTQDTLIFPNYQLLSQVNAEKCLKVVNHKVVHERVFDCKYLVGYEELVEILEYKGWMKFNNLIQKTNKSIGLNFFTYVGYYPLNEFMSYV